MFSTVQKEPEDPIYGLQVVYKKDERPHKLNVSIGIFPGKQGKALRFQVVDIAEKLIADKHLGKEYLPIDGGNTFCEMAAKLVLGNQDFTPLRYYAAQTVGGTAALYIGGKLLADRLTKQVFISDPTWLNHRKLFEACGATVKTYPYRILPDGTLDVDAILTAINAMPEGAAIILQASCHNPTGIDPTLEQWQKLSTAIKAKKLIPFFDLAYQGLGNGLAEDAASIRLFAKDGHEMLIASSFSKNFGLYNDRLGALIITCLEKAHASIASQVRKIIRALYSSPPAHGSHIVATVLEDEKLRKLWEGELTSLRQRLKKMRTELSAKITNKNPSKSIPALLKSTGLFCLTGISHEKILQLRTNDAIYLSDDSRINIAAITEDQIERLANALI